MGFRAPKSLARALAIGVPLVACSAASAQEGPRGLVYLGAAIADFERGERSPGADLMLGFGPGGPLWFVVEAAVHFGSDSEYTLDGIHLERGMFFLAAGPQVAYVGEGLRVYGHVLITYSEVGYQDPGTASDSLAMAARAEPRARGRGGRAARPAAATGYAGGTPSLVAMGGPGLSLGLGVDIFVGERSAIRIFQLEYLPSQLRETPEARPPGVPAPILPPDQSALVDEIVRDQDGWSHKFRVSVGYVYTWR